MTGQLITMNASGVGGVIQTQWSGNVAVPANGLITVNSADARDLLVAGCTYVNSRNQQQSVSAARVASAARIVASAALSNGTLAIANQPDVPRVCGLYIDPGAASISAGTGTMVYTANDGTTQTDTVSLIAASGTPFTTNTSKGVVKLTSLTIAALAGGSSPKVQINDTNALALMVDPGFVNFQVLKASVDGADETIGTVTSTAAAITPTTAPNGTHTYAFVSSYTAADI